MPRTHLQALTGSGDARSNSRRFGAAGNYSLPFFGLGWRRGRFGQILSDRIESKIQNNLMGAKGRCQVSGPFIFRHTYASALLGSPLYVVFQRSMSERLYSKSCPECGGVSPLPARVCKYCKSKFPDTATKFSFALPVIGKGGLRPMAILVAVLVIIALIVLGVLTK